MGGRFHKAKSFQTDVLKGGAGYQCLTVLRINLDMINSHSQLLLTKSISLFSWDDLSLGKTIPFTNKDDINLYILSPDCLAVNPISIHSTGALDVV